MTTDVEIQLVKAPVLRNHLLGQLDQFLLVVTWNL